MTEADNKKFPEGLLRHWPFDRIPEQNLKWLVDHLKLVRFAEGETIFSPGVCCSFLYFIHSGIVRMEAPCSEVENSTVLAEMMAGECFPLEALEEDQPVFFTFRATVTTECYCLSRPDFIEFRAIDKVFADYCHYQYLSFQEQTHRAYKLHFSCQSQ